MGWAGFQIFGWIDTGQIRSQTTNKKYQNKSSASKADLYQDMNKN